MSSGNVRAFLLRAASRATPSTSAAPLLAVPSPMSALTLCPPRVVLLQQRKAIRHNFETPSFKAIQTTDQDVGRNSAPCLSKDPRRHPELQPSRTQHGGGHQDQVDGHTGKHASQSERQAKAPKEQNPEELRAERRGGIGVKGSPAPGPP